MTRRRSRAAVYDAIDSERTYQETRWDDRTHTTIEYLLFMEHCLSEARRLASTTDLSERLAEIEVLNFVRRVTALGVVCMEDNGAPARRTEKPDAANEMTS